MTALAHHQPDAVPYDIGFTKPARATMAAYYGDPDFDAKLGNCLTWFRPHPNDVRYKPVGRTSGRMNSEYAGTAA